MNIKEQLLYALLMDFSELDREGIRIIYKKKFPSVNALRQRLGVADDTVKRRIESLRQQGFLFELEDKWLILGQKNFRYQVSFDVLELLYYGVQDEVIELYFFLGDKGIGYELNVDEMRKIFQGKWKKEVAQKKALWNGLVILKQMGLAKWNGRKLTGVKK